MSLQTLKDQKGFTIVELLIVIVVIGILAAITIVAYTGIQNRAKNSTAQSAASTLAKKAEAYFAENSQYPNTADVITGTGAQNGVTTTSTSTWYSAQGTAFTTTASTTFTSATVPASEKNVYYVPNGTNGGCIYYRDYSNSNYKNYQVGTATCTAGGPATNATSVAI